METSTPHKVTSRFAAAFYHFLISLGVFAVLAYVVLFIWYPDFFYTIDGGWEGMRIIIGVDLIMGPLLTLIVFKAGKPGLKFDLTLIGLLQVSALLAGTYVVYSERPTFFVYYDRHFYSSSADTFTRYNVDPPDPRQFDDRTPARVASVLPDNPIEEADFRRILYKDGLPAWVYQQTYQPLDEHMEQVVAASYDIANIQARDPEGRLTQWVADQGGTVDDFAFVPIHSRYRDAFVGIRRSDFEIVGIVEVPPPLSSAGAKK